jgi:hypothetical protein
MIKRLLFLIAILIPFISIGQLDVKPNYTKPFFQGSLAVKDTMQVDSVIQISNSGIIKSVNGNAFLNLRANGNDDEVEMVGSNSGFKIFGSLGSCAFGNNVDAGNDLTSEVNISNFGSALFLGNKNVGIDKTGLVGLVYNQAFSWNFDPDKPNYPTQISTQKGDYKIGVTNSASLGGFHTIVKTDNTGYVNQLGFNSGGGFETILSEITPTADRQLYLPNINDTIAARSNLLENTDITLSGNRIVTMSGNSFMFSGGETKIKGAGSDGTSEAFRVENLAGGNSSFVVDNEKHISQNSNNPISSTQYFLNSDGSEYGFRINGSHTVAGFSQTGGAPQGGYTCGGLLGGNTGFWVVGAAATTADRTGGRFYVDGANTADNTALTLRAGNGLVNRAIDSQMGDVVIQAGNVIIGANSGNASALLDVTSTTQGFLKPRLTTVQRDAIVSPASGLEVYNVTTNEPNYYDGSGWGSSVLNIFNSNGTIASDRVLTMGANNFQFSTTTGSLSIGTTVTTSKVNVGGDVETTIAGSGIIVLDELDGNRYRIHTENGNLFVELVP